LERLGGGGMFDRPRLARKSVPTFEEFGISSRKPSLYRHFPAAAIRVFPTACRLER